MRTARLLNAARRRWGKVVPLAALTVYSVWAVWIGIFIATTTSAVNADSSADWLVASAARDGLSPFEDMRVLAERYDISFVTPAWDEIGESPWVHPRPPGALLLLQPVTLLDPEALFSVTVFSSLAALGFISIVALPRLMSRRWPLGVFLGALLLFSGPMLRSLQFGAWSVVLAMLIGAFWVAARQRDSYMGGLLLGLAIAIRLFPGLLVVPLLLFRRWRTLGSAILTALVMTLLGLLRLDQTLTGAISGLLSAGDTWVGIGGNGSLIKPLVALLRVPPLLIVTTLVILVGSLAWWMKRRETTFDHIVAFTIVSMVLISPLSWEHYDAILFLVLGFLLQRDQRPQIRVVAWTWLAAMTLGFFWRQPLEQARLLEAGFPSLIGRIGLLIALILTPILPSDQSPTAEKDDRRASRS